MLLAFCVSKKVRFAATILAVYQCDNQNRKIVAELLRSNRGGEIVGALNGYALPAPR